MISAFGIDHGEISKAVTAAQMARMKKETLKSVRRMQGAKRKVDFRIKPKDDHFVNPTTARLLRPVGARA